VRQDVEVLVDDKRRRGNILDVTYLFIVNSWIDVRDILKWITDHDSLVDRKLAIEKAKLDTDYADSGKWLFKDDTFREWSPLKPNGIQPDKIQHGIQPLWLHGPGKRLVRLYSALSLLLTAFYSRMRQDLVDVCVPLVLSRCYLFAYLDSAFRTRVIEVFLEKASASKLEDRQISYFYCSKTSRSGSKSVDILRSIVRQLAWSPKDSQIEEFIEEAWKNRQSPETDKLSVGECKRFLLQLAGRCPSTTIIIDALDECDAPLELLTTLKELSFDLSEKKVSVKLFLSGRDGVLVPERWTEKSTKKLPKCLSINVTKDRVASDLSLFINRYVQNGCKRYPDLETEDYSYLRERLIDTLAKQGQGAYASVILS